MKNYEESLKLVKKHVKNKNLIKHMKACAAAMKDLAHEFDRDEEKWEVVGILHDIDYEKTMDNPEKHGIIGKEMLKDEGYSEEIYDAVEAHVGKTERDTLMKKAIYSVDPLTGLIVACALIRPEKSLDAVDADFVKRRMDEKRFAAGADRKPIRESEELGISMDKFIGIVLDSMKSISDELGL